MGGEDEKSVAAAEIEWESNQRRTKRKDLMPSKKHTSRGRSGG